MLQLTDRHHIFQLPFAECCFGDLRPYRACLSKSGLFALTCFKNDASHYAELILLFIFIPELAPLLRVQSSIDEIEVVTVVNHSHDKVHSQSETIFFNTSKCKLNVINNLSLQHTHRRPSFYIRELYNNEYFHYNWAL